MSFLLYFLHSCVHYLTHICCFVEVTTMLMSLFLKLEEKTYIYCTHSGTFWQQKQALSYLPLFGNTHQAGGRCVRLRCRACRWTVCPPESDKESKLRCRSGSRKPTQADCVNLAELISTRPEIHYCCFQNRIQHRFLDENTDGCTHLDKIGELWHLITNLHKGAWIKLLDLRINYMLPSSVFCQLACS